MCCRVLVGGVQALPNGAAPCRYQADVVGVEGHQRDGELTKIQLHGSRQSMDVIDGFQIGVHVCAAYKEMIM